MSKFRKGDWVKVTNPSNWAAYRNAVGRVESHFGNNCCYNVRFPKGTVSAFSESELSLASESDIENAQDYSVTISLAKVREVLNEELRHHILPSKIDKIINRIKQELK